MTRPVLTIAACWARAEAQLPPDTPAEIRECLRGAFYSGAAAVGGLIAVGAAFGDLQREAAAAARQATAQQERA